MSDFEVVPDSFRDTPSRGGPPSARNLALVEGKTLFVPLNGRPVGQLQSVMRVFVGSRGMRLHIRQTERDGVKGFIAWAEPKVPA